MHDVAMGGSVAEKPRYIQLLGAPGSGKSTTLYYLMWALKRQGVAVECVDEYDTKLFFFRSPTCDINDQLRFFNRQYEKLKAFLDQGEKVGVVLTDSSPYLSYLHAAFYFPEYEQELAWMGERMKKLEKEVPSYTLYIRRPVHIGYVAEGRFQPEEGAATFGAFQFERLQQEHAGRFAVFETSATEAILAHVEALMGKEALAVAA